MQNTLGEKIRKLRKKKNYTLDKLAELGERPLAEQSPRFGLTDEEIGELLGPGMIRLTSVVRIDEPRFDLRGALGAFDDLWGR